MSDLYDYDGDGNMSLQEYVAATNIVEEEMNSHSCHEDSDSDNYEDDNNSLDRYDYTPPRPHSETTVQSENKPSPEHWYDSLLLIWILRFFVISAVLLILLSVLGLIVVGFDFFSEQLPTLGICVLYGIVSGILLRYVRHKKKDNE